jgi:hypothetical protein
MDVDALFNQTLNRMLNTPPQPKRQQLAKCRYSLWKSVHAKPGSTHPYELRLTKSKLVFECSTFDEANELIHKLASIKDI